MFDKKKRRKS